MSKTITARAGGRSSRRKRAWLATAALCAAMAGVPAPGQAQTKTSRQATAAFDIPAQDLGAALTLFSDRAGLRLLLPSSVVGGKQSTAVSGTLTREQALGRLLSGTGLTYRFPDADTVTIVDPVATGAAGGAEAGSTMLEAITVVGAGNSVTEDTGSYTTGAMSSATKLPLTVHDTPQAVTVVTRQKMDDQAMTTVEDVVKNSTGLALSKWGGERPRYYSRGFLIGNVMLDGLPVNYEMDTFTSGTLAMYDHVEVVRGATGLVTGTGDPSGTLNFVRKRPGDEVRYAVTSSVGSWSDYRGEIDAGGPLNAEGTLRGRFVTAVQDRDNFIQDYENKRRLYYGTLEFDLTDATTLSIGGYHNTEDNPGADWNGLGTAPDGSFLDVPRSFRLSPSWSYWDKEAASGFVELAHEFDNGWKATITGRAINTEMDMSGTFLQPPVAQPDGTFTYNLRGGKYDYDRDQRTLDASLSGSVELFGREHELVLGASHRRSHAVDSGAAYNTSTGGFDLGTIDPYAWDPRSFPFPDVVGYWGSYSRETDVQQSALYGTGRFSLTDDLKLVAGGRVDWYEQSTTTIDGDWVSRASFTDKGNFTPYAGLIYDLTDTYSVYASYTKIFKPQDYVGATGGVLDPVTGTNYEVGVKGSYFDERLNIGLSLFKTVQQNLPAPLDASACATGLWECYRAVGEVESQGLDFEVSGEILPRWNLMFGYTFTDAEISKDSIEGAAGGAYNTFLPRHQFKLSTMYHLPGDYEKWRIGGAIRAQSKMTSVSLANYDPALAATPVVQKAFGIVDLVIGYRVNDSFDIQLNVNNVFDRKYFESVRSFNEGNFYGAPRNFVLTAKATF